MTTKRQEQAEHAKVTRAVDEFQRRIELAQHIRTMEAVQNKLNAVIEEKGLSSSDGQPWGVFVEDINNALQDMEKPA